MTAAVTLLASEGEEHVIELPMPPIAYGAIALAILIVLLLITLSFNRDR